MVRYRIRYQKVRAIRFTSHRDLLRIFRRSLASANVPVCFSRGFNPHPRFSFGPSLRTGWEGLDEYMDVQLEQAIVDLDTRCNNKLPGGLKIVGFARVGNSVPKLSADIKAARYEVTVDKSNLQEGRKPNWDSFRRKAGAAEPDEGREGLCRALEDELRRRFDSESADDNGGAREPSLLDIKISEKDGELRIDYLSTMEQGRSLFPEMLEEYIGDSLGMEVPMKVVRTALLVERDGVYHSPISKGVVQNLL
jgi:radical SAM-linked protein